MNPLMAIIEINAFTNWNVKQLFGFRRTFHATDPAFHSLVTGSAVFMNRSIIDFSGGF